MLSQTSDAPQPGLPMLNRMVERLDLVTDTVSAAELPDAVCAVLRDCLDVQALLTASQQLGSPERYTRHLLYSHPKGRFSVVALVWMPGQVTPVHGHYTWCAYGVLCGTLEEEQFRWDFDGSCATPANVVTRSAGDTVASQPGLDAIHRLRNRSDSAAISVHIYGVEGTRVSTHVNRLAELPQAADQRT